MADPMVVSMKVAASGLEAQSRRMLVVSENLANASSTGKTPGSEPYTRKTVSFESMLDDTSGANLVHVDRVDIGTQADQQLKRRVIVAFFRE